MRSVRSPARARTPQAQRLGGLVEAAAEQHVEAGVEVHGGDVPAAVQEGPGSIRSVP